MHLERHKIMFFFPEKKMCAYSKNFRPLPQTHLFFLFGLINLCETFTDFLVLCWQGPGKTLLSFYLSLFFSLFIFLRIFFLRSTTCAIIVRISLNIFYCQILYSNGVGSQVLTTLVTTLPLVRIDRQQLKYRCR